MQRTRPYLAVKLNEDSDFVGISELKDVFTPPATDTFHPISHNLLVTEFVDRIFDRNLIVAETMHSLSHAGLRYFGILEVRSKAYDPDYSWIIGILNNNDKRNAAQVFAGLRIFSSNVVLFTNRLPLQRKHTKDLTKNLPTLVDECICDVHNKWSAQDKRVECYKKCHLPETHSSNLIIKAMDANVIAPREIPRVLRFYRRPRDQEFQPRTAWSLINAFGQTLQTLKAKSLIDATISLSGLFDTVCRFDGSGDQFIQVDFTQQQTM